MDAALTPSNTPPTPRRPLHRRLLRLFGVALMVLAGICLLVVLTLLLWTPGKHKTARGQSAYFRCPCPLILAHQGASGHAPSNTLASFRLAQKMHADILEMDIHMSKDGILVLSHDAKVDRLTDGKGLIKEKTFAQLRALDAGYRFTKDGKTFPYRAKGIKIPSLEEVFRTFPQARYNIELKQKDPPMEAKLWQLLQKHKLASKTLVTSFHTNPLLRWRAQAGDQANLGASMFQVARFALLWFLRLDGLWRSDLDAFQLPARGRDGRLSFLHSPRWIQAARRHGLKLHYWTINDIPTMKKLLRAGADGLITDYPDRAWQAIQDLKLRQPPQPQPRTDPPQPQPRTHPPQPQPRTDRTQPQPHTHRPQPQTRVHRPQPPKKSSP